jgi:hypothetical protein
MQKKITHWAMREGRHPRLSLGQVGQRRKGWDRERRPTFIELLQKRPMGTVPIAQQVTEHMRLLLPKVHRLLVILPTLVDQNVDQLRVGRVAVLLETLADNGTHCGRWDVEAIQCADFRRLQCVALRRIV